jgi:hypothetical protein
MKKENQVTEPTPKYEYELGEPPITFEESLELPYYGEDSLFCDTEFLETIIGKPLKKVDECR